MDIRDYQRSTPTTAVYVGKGEIRGLSYVTMGLCGEAGECANQVKKILRDDNTSRTPERLAKIEDEVGDTLWYLAQLCNELGLDLDSIARSNLAKLAVRHKAGQVHGDRRDGTHE